jgi:hypothetical protein
MRRGRAAGGDDAPPAQAAVQYTAAQLDQMLAPVALCPDPLLSQVLMAATYPLEVVEADRWVSEPANAALKGEALAAALEPLPWDPSVKSLVPFPQILHMMDSNLDWTERLGEAFVTDQAAVMGSVQRLRQRAQAAGRLASTPQQVVITQGPDIAIEPASPEIVYVPVYDPSLVYGIWPYPDYPPFGFPGFFPGVVIADGVGFGWFGVGTVGPLWGWNHWDWRAHRIDIDRDRFAYLNDHRPPPGAVWEHNPAHRWSVPYRTPALRERYAGQAPEMQRSFRGYPPAASPPARTAPGAVPPHVAGSPALRPPAPVRQAPVFESFGRGPEVRSQAQRGFESRTATPRFTPHFGGGQPVGPRGHG